MGALSVELGNRDPMIRQVLENIPVVFQELDQTDPGAFGEVVVHGLGVAGLLARQPIQLDKLQVLIGAALLHDIAKRENRFLQLAVLPRGLSDIESNVMRQHQTVSAQIIRDDLIPRTHIHGRALERIARLVERHHPQHYMGNLTISPEEWLLCDLLVRADKDEAISRKSHVRAYPVW